MTRDEIIEKLTSGIAELKDLGPGEADEAIRSLVGYLLQLRELVAPGQNDYWHTKTVEELAREQGVGPAKFEDLWGAGADLWKDEEDFQSFLRACKGLD